jgi:hypothetical protein
MTGFSSQTLNELLRSGIGSLDITASERDLAIARYTDVAHSLGEHWDSDPSDGLVYPQGSMRLGTVTRKYHGNDEIDIDLVARRDQPKESISQADLKEDTGLGLEKFVLGGPEGSPALDEGKRCWTLHYVGFHLDVLPALPNLGARRAPPSSSRTLNWSAGSFLIRSPTPTGSMRSWPRNSRTSSWFWPSEWTSSRCPLGR